MTTTTNPKAPKGFFAGISGIKSGVANIIDAGKTFKTLGPSQIKDEIQIAKHELKTKGIAVGKGAAFFGVAAVFGLFLIIALVAAAILGLGTVMPYWASALVFALIAAAALFPSGPLSRKEMRLVEEAILARAPWTSGSYAGDSLLLSCLCAAGVACLFASDRGEDPGRDAR